MQSNNQLTTGSIHCKVSCNDQFRRFLFVGTEFCSLFAQVQQVLALDKEFVLKYKDIEGDLITLSSDEELACALNYSDGIILRLSALPLGKETETVDSDGPSAREFHCGRRGMRGGCGRGGRGRCGWGPEMRKAKLLSKQTFFMSILDELEKLPEKTPEQQQQIASLQKKLKKIEFRLEGAGEHAHCAKWAAKAEKRKKKFEKRMQKGEKCPRHALSEETQTQIALLKSQIDVLKPGLKEIKTQIKSKKAALKEVHVSGVDPQQLLKEIAELKEKKKEQRSQVMPLKAKIRELKNASC